MANTVKDAALSLRETTSCADIIATMTAVTLRKNGRELTGACPRSAEVTIVSTSRRITPAPVASAIRHVWTQ